MGFKTEGREFRRSETDITSGPSYLQPLLIRMHRFLSQFAITFRAASPAITKTLVQNRFNAARNIYVHTYSRTVFREIPGLTSGHNAAIPRFHMELNRFKRKGSEPQALARFG